MTFTWIPFYRELAQKFLQFKDNRTPLVNWIYDNLQGYLNHFKDGPDGRPMPDVDPFTVFAIFNRDITEDKRKEIVKDVAKMAEAKKVHIRNIRRDTIEDFKKMKKEGEITEDDLKKSEKKVQELTDKYIKSIDQLCEAKQKEVMSI